MCSNVKAHEYLSPLQGLFFVTEPVLVGSIFFSTDTLREVRSQPVLQAGGRIKQKNKFDNRDSFLIILFDFFFLCVCVTVKSSV